MEHRAASSATRIAGRSASALPGQCVVLTLLCTSGSALDTDTPWGTSFNTRTMFSLHAHGCRHSSFFDSMTKICLSVCNMLLRQLATWLWHGISC